MVGFLNTPDRQLTLPLRLKKRLAAPPSDDQVSRLNILAHCQPFCRWYKQRSNDPL